MFGKRSDRSTGVDSTQRVLRRIETLKRPTPTQTNESGSTEIKHIDDFRPVLEIESSTPETQITKIQSSKDAISPEVAAAKTKLQSLVMEKIDMSSVSSIPKDQFKDQLLEFLNETARENSVMLNESEKNILVKLFLDDMFGLGPLEPLLKDDSITDIMVNAPNEVYIERHGLIEKTDVTFTDVNHIQHVATRIATRVHRRIDESSPMVDARLEDGSRVNIILPPLSFKSPTISIRKFAKLPIDLAKMVEQGNMSADMATFLRIASGSRLNILISGGTGSGKTTLLNAMAKEIKRSERIITIEDAAELQLEQPHVVTLESRPANLEGVGEVSIRDLLVNSLRMRPDRIIIGEVRAKEVVDMLQAMNTGHDGSMGTLHANSPRDAMIRLENLFAMSGTLLPSQAIRTVISSAVHIIVQISRMTDGKRRITNITEIVGIEGDVITSHDLFTYKQHGSNSEGTFESTGITSKCVERLQYFGFEEEVHQIFHSGQVNVQSA